MKGSVIALGHIQDRAAAAWLVDGKLHDFLVDPRHTNTPLLGAIYRGVVDRPIKGSGATMVKLGDGNMGFLKHSKGLAPGQRILVQVSGLAEDGKAAPVTTKVVFKGRNALVTPGAPGANISKSIRDEENRLRIREILADVWRDHDDFGLIVRSAADEAADDELSDEITALLSLSKQVMGDEGDSAELLLESPDAHALAMREWPRPDIFDDGPDAFENHGVLDHIDEICAPGFKLGTSTIFIEPTRALVAIDVNTGSDSSLAAGLKANIALARALPSQLRCRGLGGQIVIDLAPMPKKERRNWEQILRAAFRDDPIDTVFAGWTPLGNFELQRKKERHPTAKSVTT